MSTKSKSLTRAFVLMTMIFIVGFCGSLRVNAQRKEARDLRENLRLIETFDFTQNERYQITFTKKSDIFLTTRNRLTKQWSFRKGDLKRNFAPCGDNKNAPMDLYNVGTDLNDDGNILAIACDDFSVEVWNLDSVERTIRFQVQKLKGSQSLHPYVSNDGQRILLKFTGTGEVAELWDSQNGKKLADLTSRSAVCPTCNRTVYYANAFSPNGKIVAVSFGGMVFLWDAQTGQLLHRLIDENAKLYGDAVLSHKGIVSQSIFTKDSKIVITAAGDGTAKSWDVTTGRLARTFNKHSYNINHVALSPDERILATSSARDTFQLWNRETGELIWNSPTIGRGLNYLSFSPDGKRILSRTDSKLTIWDLESRKSLEEISVPDELYPNFSPDWRLFTGFDKKTKKIGLYEYLGR